MRLRDIGVSLALHGVLCGAVVAAWHLAPPVSQPLVIPLSFELVEASLPAAPSSEPGPVPAEKGPVPVEERPVPIDAGSGPTAAEPIPVDERSVPTEESPMESPEEPEEVGTDPAPVGRDPENVEEICENRVESAESASENVGTDTESVGTDPVPDEQAKVVSDPVALNRIVPVYPRSARRKGHEGNVTMAVVVTETGDVASVDILASSGHAELDAAARTAVRTARFAPATEDGVNVSGRVRLTVAFKLKGGWP